MRKVPAIAKLINGVIEHYQTHVGFIERMLLDFFRPVELNEPLQIGDIILYFGGPRCFPSLTGAGHYGRVVVASAVDQVAERLMKLNRDEFHERF